MIALLALLLSVPASAFDGGAAARVQDAISMGVEYANHAVVQGSDESVYGSGQALQTLVSGGSGVVYRPSLHEVRRAEVTGKSADLRDLLDESRRQLQLAPSSHDALEKNVALQERLNAERRIGFDRSLDDTEMGVYRYTKGRVSEGNIALNSWLSDMARLVGNAFASATLVHEAGHAGDAELAGKNVVDGELPAFKIQYAWLQLIDPTGERLALLRVSLDAQMKAHPNALTQMAINYAKTLDVLRGTNGDDKKLELFIAQLGYEEGVGKNSVGVPES